MVPGGREPDSHLTAFPTVRCWIDGNHRTCRRPGTGDVPPILTRAYLRPVAPLHDRQAIGSDLKIAILRPDRDFQRIIGKHCVAPLLADLHSGRGRLDQ